MKSKEAVLNSIIVIDIICVYAPELWVNLVFNRLPFCFRG